MILGRLNYSNNYFVCLRTESWILRVSGDDCRLITRFAIEASVTWGKEFIRVLIMSSALLKSMLWIIKDATPFPSWRKPGTLLGAGKSECNRSRTDAGDTFSNFRRTNQKPVSPF
jgi:hypothetical protein